MSSARDGDSIGPWPSELPSRLPKPQLLAARDSPAARRSRPRSRPASASAPSVCWAGPSRTSRARAEPPAPTGCRLSAASRRRSRSSCAGRPSATRKRSSMPPCRLDTPKPSTACSRRSRKSRRRLQPPPRQADASPQQLQQWWVDHMLTTSTPFAERMTLFWHGHFTSDYRKTADNTFMYWQNLTWRRMALTSLGPMLTQVTTDPAMLRYLDLATSTGQSPNENYSRELMELFTMGAGNYTEEDVRQSAKALAGWQQPPPDSIAMATVDAAKQVTRRLPVYTTQATGVFNTRRAFNGSVTYLGKTG